MKRILSGGDHCTRTIERTLQERFKLFAVRFEWEMAMAVTSNFGGVSLLKNDNYAA